MMCRVCRDKANKPTGTLELARTFSFSFNDQGVPAPESAVCIDEYISCNNCNDPSCRRIDCSPTYWAEDTKGERRLHLATLPATLPAKV